MVPLILALKRQRQAGEFKASFVYISSSKPASASYITKLCLKKERNKEITYFL